MSVVVLADPAAANYAAIRAVAECAVQPGSVNVSYVASSWASGAQGANPQIAIDVSVNGGAYAEFETIAFPDSPTIPEVAGSLTVTGVNDGDTIRLRARPEANWGGGNIPKATQIRESGLVEVDDDCVEVTAAVTHDCAVADGAIVATATGTPGAQVRVVLNDASGNFLDDETLTTGVAPVSTSFPAADGTYRVFASLVGGSVLADQLFVVECSQVLGSEIPAPPTAPGTEVEGSVLARTGAQIAGALLLAIALVGLGLLLRGAAASRHRAG